MKVIEVLRYIDFLENIHFYISAESTENPVYEGSVLDLPWIYADMELDNSDNGEAISTFHDNGKTYIEIFAKEI